MSAGLCALVRGKASSPPPGLAKGKANFYSTGGLVTYEDPAISGAD